MNISKDGSLNELSPALLNRAADKADDKGRFAQKKTFNAGSEKEIERMLGGIIKVTRYGDGGLHFITSIEQAGGSRKFIEFKYIPDNDSVDIVKYEYFLSRKLANGLIGVFQSLNPNTKLKSLDALAGSGIRVDGVHGSNN